MASSAARAHSTRGGSKRFIRTRMRAASGFRCTTAICRTAARCHDCSAKFSLKKFTTSPRKITRAVALIKNGLQKKLYLGNLDAKRDWGYAKEFVEAMWLMLQQPEADDYVIATNETHSVREFLEHAFAHAGLNWQDYVEF